MLDESNLMHVTVKRSDLRLIVRCEPTTRVLCGLYSLPAPRQGQHAEVRAINLRGLRGFAVCEAASSSPVSRDWMPGGQTE